MEAERIVWYWVQPYYTKLNRFPEDFLSTFDCFLLLKGAIYKKRSPAEFILILVSSVSCAASGP